MSWRFSVVISVVISLYKKNYFLANFFVCFLKSIDTYICSEASLDTLKDIRNLTYLK